jgi:hypothetical protein
MRGILAIDTREILKKYGNRTDSDFMQETADRSKTLCHAHKDTSPSLIIYDKTEQGEGWDYHCFVCGAHGTNIDMVIELGVAPNKKEAVALLRKDFGLELPLTVNTKDFCRLKGLDYEFCDNNGVEDYEGGITFPTYDVNHDIVYNKVRTKYEGKDKYYFKTVQQGKHSALYGMQWLDTYNKDKPLFLVEGETDSLTLAQAGYQVLGVPSASSWNKDFHTLTSEFNKLVVCRDNDKAGKKLVQSIKELRSAGLYSIEFFGAIKDINDFHNLRCKADISMFKSKFVDLEHLPVTYDSLLAEIERAPKAIQNVKMMTNVTTYIDNPIELDLMINGLSKITKVSKKAIKDVIATSAIKQQVETSDETVSDNLFVRDNMYYKNAIVNGEPRTIAISNFIVRPTKVIDTDGEIVRVLKLINGFGKISRSVVFTAEELANPIKFTARCMGAGDYIFKGSIQDLQAIIELIFNKQLKPIMSPKKIGKMDSGAWLFKSFGIDNDGKIVKADDEGIINFGEGKGAYLPSSIVLGDDIGSSSASSIPDLKYDLEYDEQHGKETLGLFITQLRRSFGTFAVYNAVGWALAGIASHSIFEKYKMFPYLFVAGKRNSGKTTLAGIIYEMFGFGQHNIASIESPTNVGMLRTLAYMSSMPVAYDDYRNTKKIKYKDNLLLDIYNRHSSVKGTSGSMTAIRQEPINGYVMLSGEDIPSNNALRTRCVLVQVSANEGVRNRKALASLYSMLPEVQHYMVHTMQKLQSDFEISELLDSIEKSSDALTIKVRDQRYAFNHGIVAGAFLHEFGDILSGEEVAEYLEWLADTSLMDKQAVEDTHSEALFFSDITHLAEVSTVGTDTLLVEDDTLYIRMRLAHKQWTKYLKSTGSELEAITESTLKSYLTKESYYLGYRQVSGMSGTRSRALAFSLSGLEEDYPDIAERLRSIVEEEY